MNKIKKLSNDELIKHITKGKNFFIVGYILGLLLISFSNTNIIFGFFGLTFIILGVTSLLTAFIYTNRLEMRGDK